MAILRSLNWSLDFDINFTWMICCPYQAVFIRNEAGEPIRGRIWEPILQFGSSVDRNEVAPFHKVGKLKHSMQYHTFESLDSAWSTERPEITTHVSARVPDVIMHLLVNLAAVLIIKFVKYVHT